MVKYLGMRILIISLIFPILSLAQLPEHLDFDELPICPKNIETWCKVHVDNVRPTQRNVGFYHMGFRVKEINKMVKKKEKKDIKELQRKKTTQFILGPNEGIFINDRHHYSSALHHSNLKNDQKFVAGQIVQDWSDKKPEKFWTMMVDKNWAFLKDKNFNPIDYTEIPTSLDDLNDNPYRSLVSQVFREHAEDGIAKVGIPFEEFFYGEFLKAKGLAPPKNDKRSMKKIRKKAVKILKSEDGVAFMNGLKAPSCNPAKLLKQLINKK